MWSLGVILLEISTGLPVFENKKSRIELYRNKTALSVGAFGKAPKVRVSDGTVLACKHDILQEEQIKFSINSKKILQKLDYSYGLGKNPDFIDLVSKILVIDPALRLTPSEVLSHNFL